jgi:uncharacterized protein with PQ loop repeat
MQYEIFGYLGGMFLCLQLWPQIYKTYKNKDASQLSLFFMGLNWIGLGCMVLYGFFNKDPPLYIPAGISLFNTSILIALKCYYSNSSNIDLYLS